MGFQCEQCVVYRNTHNVLHRLGSPQTACLAIIHSQISSPEDNMENTKKTSNSTSQVFALQSYRHMGTITHMTPIRAIIALLQNKRPCGQ